LATPSNLAVVEVHIADALIPHKHLFGGGKHVAKIIATPNYLMPGGIAEHINVRLRDFHVPQLGNIRIEWALRIGAPVIPITQPIWRISHHRVHLVERRQYLKAVT
jgi:hypothetical protein